MFLNEREIKKLAHRKVCQLLTLHESRLFAFV